MAINSYIVAASTGCYYVVHSFHPALPRYISLFFRVLVVVLSSGSMEQALAQNLVANPSFETYTQYPCSIRVGPPDNISNYLLNWYSPTFGTPDIWNCEVRAVGICSNTVLGRAPLDGVDPSTLLARTGLFYMGLFSAYTVRQRVEREYMQTRLSQPLTKGKVYDAEMWVRADHRTLFFTNNLGMLFTDQTYIIPKDATLDAPLIPLAPQINEANLVSDTATWYRVSGQFVATGPHEYLTIGNFFDDKHTHFEAGYQGVSAKANGAYYHVDDISLTDAHVDYLVTVPDLGPDTTLCIGQSLPVRLPPVTTTTYRWQDGSAALERTFTQAGTYYVTATTGAYSVTDSLRVRIEKPVDLISLHDTTLCQSESLTLRASDASGRRLRWNTGAVSDTLTVSQSGTYQVSVPGSHCVFADTVGVAFVACPGAVPNVFTPNGDGRNETFYVENIAVRAWRLEVYNRWGRQVYQTDRYDNEWRGDGLEGGLYYYWLHSAELKRELKGWVEILR